ncbi:hypothetical protein ABZX39_33605 [Streptomyces collinus]|uniref:hypothetical protein n=1 Tax=Streptomyces collinus TaxID=42684 RepID=UPI0033B46CCA
MQLDFMALALLTILLRHRDGWDITLAEIGAKYGYGRDAMANAMGLLQAARYVVKIRLMSAENNQWSTEVCVYDTPATDAEIAALLREASREPDVRVAQVIEPTKAAMEHAAKRRSKLQPKSRRRTTPTVAVPRVPENPDSGATCENEASPQVGPECRDPRQSGGPALFKKTIDEKTKNRPSVPEEATDRDGGTDGTRLPRQINRNPGVDLLLAIGAEQPEFLLTGKTLQDQGMAAAGMLVSGWTPEQVRQIVAGRPLPDQIKTTVGAVIARRLRDACAAPAPGSVTPEAPMRKAVASPPDGIPRGDCSECGARIRLTGQALDDGLCPLCREEMAAAG